MKKWADVRIEMTVEFDDDGDLNLKDQAIEAAEKTLGVCALSAGDFVTSVEVVGEVRDTEMPK